MSAILLETDLVEKPWGLTNLPAPFADVGKGRRIGEIWYPAPPGMAMPILVKYLFTSDKLSIQVHPDDAQAHERGLSSGKEECWYILEAEPGAVIGMGTKRALSAQELREASLSGEIENLMEWHPVKAGTLFHITPGTVHAIGAGITLIEVQQNIDLTYRLYDYGRPRELHLDDGAIVSDARPFPPSQISHVDHLKSALLLTTKHFSLAHVVAGDIAPVADVIGQISVIPLTGSIQIDGKSIKAGECCLADNMNDIKFDGSALVAWK